MTEELIQGSNEWLSARCGSLGASRIHDALAKTKTGWGASRDNIMAELITERLTGVSAPSFVNAAMQWGIEHEPDARLAYQFMRDVEVVQVGLIKHPSINGAHASPDGLVGSEGLIEIKCPSSATHIDTLLSGSIPGKYNTQMQWQMICTDRKWCDFVSYDPRLPESMRLFIKRVERDSSLGLETAVIQFIDELDNKLVILREKFG